MYDVFVSYSSADRQYVEAIVSAFRQRGLSVWWDQFIGDGRWGLKIEEALNNSRKVVAFISKSVAASDRYYVQAEMQRAHADSKLIPVKIGEFTMSLMIEGIVIGEQMFFASDFNEFLNGSAFQRICGVLGLSASPSDEPKPATAADWLDTGPALSELSLAIAVSVAESAPLATVTGFAQDLEARLSNHLDAGAPKPKLLGDLLVSRSRRLQKIGAVRYAETHARLGVEYDCIRFEDNRRASQLFASVWDEYDNLRPTIVEWLDHLTHTANADARQRIGLMVGALARERFSSVFDTLISRWMLDDHPATRDLADIALSVAAFEAVAEKAIAEIVRELSIGRTTERLRAAVELACGFTGSQIDGLSIEVLKQVARSKHADFNVTDVMRASIQFMVSAAMDTSDNSLFNLDKIVAELSNWARMPSRDEHQRLPMFLFLSLMERLPLRAPDAVDGLLSLGALMTSQDNRIATAAVFEAALRDPGDSEFSPRDGAQQIIRTWLEQPESKENLADNPLLTLLRTIFGKCTTERDRNRLAFLVRGSFSRDSLAPPVVENVLSNANN